MPFRIAGAYGSGKPISCLSKHNSRGQVYPNYCPKVAPYLPAQGGTTFLSCLGAGGWLKAAERARGGQECPPSLFPRPAPYLAPQGGTTFLSCFLAGG